MPRGIPAAGHRRKRGNAKTLRVCKTCGCPFETYAYRLGYERSKFCSRECYSVDKDPSKSPVRTCGHCGEPIFSEPPHYSPNKQYCSRKCVAAGRRKVTCTCRHCGDSFETNHPGQRWCWTCAPDSRARERLKKYDICASEWEAMIAAQDGTCALCDKKPVVLDHDHATGKVRGALCCKCNHFLHAVDQVEWLERAVQYVSGA